MNYSYPYYRPSDTTSTFHTTPGSKFEDDGYVYLLGILITPYCLIGYDSPSHFSEET
jgi:amino acid transporter